MSNLSTPPPQQPIAGNLPIDTVWYRFFTGISKFTGLSGILSGSNGGTGIDNGSSKITVSGDFTVSSHGGAISFPTAGTVMTMPAASKTLMATDFSNASAAGGDLTGTYPNPTVSKAGGVAFGPYATAALGQLPGTATNDNASAGNVGQELEGVVASGAALALTTGTQLTITSIVLTAGDWDVWAYIGFTGGATTTVNYLAGSLSLVNNTIDNTRTRCGSVYLGGAAAFGTLSPIQFAAGHDRFSVAANTTVYLVALSAFGTSTASAFGTIIGRVRR